MTLITDKSQIAFEEARKILPGGVNSPVRSFKSIGRTPLFIAKGQGSYLWDIDENKYIDYCLSWGSLILGHAYSSVINKVSRIIQNGTSYGAPTLAETELATLISGTIPSIEKIRFVNSGTEAVMSAIRLARAYTGKNLIVKFDGCYHGHSDSLLVAAGSGLAHISTSTSSGISSETVRYTASLPFNDIQTFESFVRKHRHKIAAVILEVVPANMGLVLPDPKFLKIIEEYAGIYKYLVIADEVITGFRFEEGSAQQHFNFSPHLTTLGKIIGGGFPVGAYGGKNEIMQLIAPEGEVYQAGTLSGNPVAMTAGIETLSLLKQSEIQKRLTRNTNHLFSELEILAEKYNITLNRLGSMFTLFLTNRQINSFNDSKFSLSEKTFAEFYQLLLAQNIYLSPSMFETNFISTEHTLEDLDYTAQTIENAFKKLTK